MHLEFWDTLHSVILSRALYSAAELGLADHLHSQACDIATVASLTKTDALSLERLLRFLVVAGFFDKQSDGTYRNNGSSEYMRKDHPQTIYPFILHDDETRWNSFGHLSYSVKTGKPSFDMLYKKSYFEYLADHPTLSHRFDAAMTIISDEEETTIATALDFEGTVADIGGGRGTLLKKIMDAHPVVMSTILFDLPQVVAAISVADLTPVTTAVGGSFFEPMSIEADIFVLKRVLHDWNDEQSVTILQNIAATMRDTDTLYVVDAIVDECADKKMITAVDLGLFAIFGGKERDYAEFHTIFAAAGLLLKSHQTITQTLHVMKCQKK
jgi:hypothetical protein